MDVCIVCHYDTVAETGISPACSDSSGEVARVGQGPGVDTQSG